MVGQLVRGWLPGALVLAMGWSASGIVRAETTGETESDSDSDTEGDAFVEIIAPADGASYPSAPAAVDVQVNASGVEGYAVRLLVDGAPAEGGCEISGICAFAIELAAGEHELQAEISGGEFPIVSSDIVHVSVDDGTAEAGEEAGEAGEEAGEAGEEAGEAGEEAGEAGEEAGEAGEESGGEESGGADDDKSGCAVDRRGAGSGALVLAGMVLGGLGWGRRRRA
jgi:hypothetical protein